MDDLRFAEKIDKVHDPGKGLKRPELGINIGFSGHHPIFFGHMVRDHGSTK